MLKKHAVTKPEGKKPVQKVEDIEKEFKALKKFLSGEECVHTEGVSYVWTNIFVDVYDFPKIYMTSRIIRVIIQKSLYQNINRK